MPDVNDHMVSGILDWVTLLELNVGPVTITLLSAAVTEEDDNISSTFFDEWKITDLKLEGMAAVDCGAFRNRDVGVSVVVDITNPPGDDDTFVKVATCRSTEKSRNAALWTGTVSGCMLVRVCKYCCEVVRCFAPRCGPAGFPAPGCLPRSRYWVHQEVDRKWHAVER